MRTRKSSILRMSAGFVLLTAIIATTLVQAQSATVAPVTDPLAAEAIALDKKILAEAKSGSEIMANLTYLSDIIGPRLTGSAALKRANEWAAAKMTSYGLSNVHQERWTIPLGWERGSAYARILEPDNGRLLSMASAGWTPGTKGRIVGDVVVLTAKDRNELVAYKGKLNGAIVLLGAPRDVSSMSGPRQFPGGRQGGTAPGTGMPLGPNARGEAGFAERFAFFRELSEFPRNEGALVILQDAAKPHGLLNTGGGGVIRNSDRASAVEGIPSMFVAHEHYALLHRLATRTAQGRVRLEIEVNNKLIPGPIAVNNTIGEIRGSDKPDEVVILGAHLDSWDLAQGTTDNGTGTSVVLEAARILNHAGVHPRRTIRFCLFTGEEQGLLGSAAYVNQHKEELPRISMCLVHDFGTGRVNGFGLQARDSLKPILEKELVSLKELGFKDYSMRPMGGSDHASFDRVGVPGFYCLQESADYFLTHHSQSDTLDKAREPDLIQGAQVMAVSAVRIANMTSMLPRDKKPQNNRRADQGKAGKEKSP